MTAWNDALNSLGQREMSGKTAQLLIEAGNEAMRSMTLDYEERITGLEGRISDAEATSAQREQTADELRSALERKNQEVVHLKSPRRSTSVEGEVVKYQYSPANDNTLWRLDEIESALMHLRLAGGDDSTHIRVESGLLRTSLRDDGQPVTGWVSGLQGGEPALSEKELKRIRWARPRAWIIAGFIGFTLGGWVGMTAAL